MPEEAVLMHRLKQLRATNRRLTKQVEAAAARQLDCDFDGVPRKLLGREPWEMDRQTITDWAVLMKHLSLLFYAEEERWEDGPAERDAADA